jgi:hypothetical protein
MVRSLAIAVVLALVSWCVPPRHVQAQSTQLRLQGGNVTLRIQATGGVLQPAVNSQTSLRWTMQNVETKVTVQTFSPGQSYFLSVVGINMSNGQAAPEVILSDGMPPVDFVVDIPIRPPGPGSGGCDLRYTARATIEQGNSFDDEPDIHTVVYTLVAQ